MTTLSVIAEIVFKICTVALFVYLIVQKNKAEDRYEALTTMIVNMASALERSSRKAKNDIDDVRNYISEVDEELCEKIEVLKDKYAQADEMIKEVTETAKEAAETERKVQEGIDSILNYSGLESLKKTVK